MRPAYRRYPSRRRRRSPPPFPSPRSCPEHHRRGRASPARTRWPQTSASHRRGGGPPGQWARSDDAELAERPAEDIEVRIEEDLFGAEECREQEVLPPPPPPVEEPPRHEGIGTLRMELETRQRAERPGVVPGEQETTVEGGRCCAIGCIVLAVIAVVGLYLLGRWAGGKVEEQLQEGVANQIEIREPGEEGGEAPSNSGVDISEPREEGAAPDAEDDELDLDDISRMLGEGLGEAWEDIAEQLPGAQVDGFDPKTAPPALVPVFYGFIISLAEDNPQAMHQWMSPQYKQEWLPENWPVAEDVEHLSYTMDSHRTLGDGTETYDITEHLRKKDTDEEGTITWTIHFQEIEGQWYVTSFGKL